MENKFLKLAVSTLAVTMAFSGAVLSAQAVNTDTAPVTTDIAAVNTTVTENVELTAPKISSLKSVVGGVKVSWAKVDGAASYRIYRKTRSSDWVAIGNADDTSYTDGNAKSGKTYIYCISCLDVQGNPVSSYGKQKEIRYIAAPVITKFKNTRTGTKITWEKVKGASSYTVYYLDGKNKWKKLGTTKNTSFTHDDLKSGKTYTYRVRCLDGKGKKIGGYEENGSANLFVTPPAVSSVKNTVNGVHIKWKSAKGSAAYRIYRKTKGSDWTYIGMTESLSYTDKTVKSGKKYTYTVKCLDADGKLISTGGSEKSITYIKAPLIKSFENTQSGTKITWEKSSGASSYAVYYLKDGKSWKKLAEVKGTSYTHKNLKSGKTYTYKIRCLDKKGKTTGAAESGKENIFTAPQNISQVSKVQEGYLIRWNSVSVAVGGYAVYRKSWNDSWTQLARVTDGTEYIDASAQTDAVYSYAIRCLDKDGKAVTAVPEKAPYYKDGILAHGKININSKSYTFDNGYLRSGLQTIDGKTYYYDENGNIKKNGIVGSDSDGWYYANKKGIINFNYVNGIDYGGKNWIVINGKARKVRNESDKTLYRAAKEVAKATNTKMTKAQKLKACFEYTRETYSECRPRTPHYTGNDWPVLYANDMFVNGKGNCFSYAAAFAYMAKAIGYEKVYSCNSGGHGWAEVDGLIYDPEWSLHNTAHTYYGLDYNKVKDPDYKGGISSGEAWKRVEIK